MRREKRIAKALWAVVFSIALLAAAAGPAFAVYVGQEVMVSGPNPFGLLAACLTGGGIAGAAAVLRYGKRGKK